MRIRRSEHRAQIRLHMTPMIDVVFQLMVFFVFTFKIILPEESVNVGVSAAASSPAAAPRKISTLKVRLRGGEDRRLSAVELGGVNLPGDDPLLTLQAQLRRLVGDSASPSLAGHEVELQADYDLEYRYVIKAIAAINGYVDPVTGVRHGLIEKVRLAPLARAAAR